MSIEIRKAVDFIEEIYTEGAKTASRPLKLFASALVLRNPWTGRGFVQDLRPEIHSMSSTLGSLLTERMLAIAGGGDKIEAYGKACVTGLAGEIEHGSALIHTLRFGNHYREAVAAKSYLAFTNSRGPANCPIVVPLMHKDDSGIRSHYLTVQFSISDAPTQDEIVVVLGGATGGRPHHRIGDRYQDLQDLGRSLDNPAGI
jgi:hypothetical protein